MDHFARLPSDLGALEGEPVPLAGGITNHNYRVRLGGRDYVLRVCGQHTGALGIDRACEVEATELAARLGVGPEVVAVFTDPPALLTSYIDGRTLAAQDVCDPGRIRRLAGVLRAVHDSGAQLPSRFDCFRIVEAYALAARAHGGELPAAYARAHEHAREIEAALGGPDHVPVPIHADLLCANLLEEPDGRLRIVDWEYAGMGHRLFDLGNLAVNNGFGADEEELLLEEYFGAAPTAQRRATLALMKLMSDFREAMWGAVQSAVSTLEFDFAAYAAEHFARLEATAGSPGYSRWLEDARGSA